MEYYLINEQDVCDIIAKLEEYLFVILEEYTPKDYEDDEDDSESIVNEINSKQIGGQKNNESID